MVCGVCLPFFVYETHQPVDDTTLYPSETAFGSDMAPFSMNARREGVMELFFSWSVNLVIRRSYLLGPCFGKRCL